jgi:hypothetical protein
MMDIYTTGSLDRIIWTEEEFQHALELAVYLLEPTNQGTSF